MYEQRDGRETITCASVCHNVTNHWGSNIGVGVGNWEEEKRKGKIESAQGNISHVIVGAI